jgi:hypothetical protein
MGERVEGGKLGGGKGKRLGGFRLNSHPLPPLESEQREGGRRLGCGRPAAIAGKPGHGSGREVGENGGESRGSHPYAHLGPGLLVEAAPRRRATAGYGGWWWWCSEAWEVGVDVKSAPHAKHTASRTIASHAKRSQDVPVNFP